MNRFESVLGAHNLELCRAKIRVLQLNLGKRCNQTCAHCHVNAGPARREMMERETAEKIVAWLENTAISTVDITGGAPELNPHFRFLVREARAQGRAVMDRCNLTILWEENQGDLAEFLAAHEVEIVASLPCYSPENVNAQRGDGVFEKSVAALQRLNALGYARDPKLRLHLVYNPLGATLPPAQSALERDYKRELRAHFGIEFNSLFALANLPISRFEAQLRREGTSAQYAQLLETAFNPATIANLMCRDTLSVGWRGEIYDCDFNQMLNLRRREAAFLWDLLPEQLENAPIFTGKHCFGCTAGAGSSCGGAVI